MLSLAEDASTIVNRIVTQQDLGEDGGLRISGGNESSPNLELAVVKQAEPGDQVVVGQAGASVYLDESAATLLDDKVLHAAIDESGQVAFSLALQA